MSTIFSAHTFAIQAHAGQIDKGGQPYIRHLERVANASVTRAGHARFINRLDLDPMEVMQAAILHDVLEDTPTTPSDLRAAGAGGAGLRSQTGQGLRRGDDAGAIVKHSF